MVLSSGMIVFKLERERPPYTLHQDSLYYVKDRYLRLYDVKSQRDNPIVSVRRPGGSGSSTPPRSLSYNPAEHAILLTNDADGGTFELYILPRDSARGDSSPVSIKFA